MKAAEHLIGVGLVFPHVSHPDGASEGEAYYSVNPDWEVESTDEEELPQDREGDAAVDGEALMEGVRQ